MKKINKDISSIAYRNLLQLLTDCFPDNKTPHTKTRDCFIAGLNNYLILLQKFEQDIKNKKNIVADQEKFHRMSERLISIGDTLEKGIESFSIKSELKELFRECIGKWAYQSQIVKRSFDKPRGYGGDYKTIEMFYDQKTFSQGIGYYFDKHILDNKLAKADIYRKDRMKELLNNFIDKSDLNEMEIVNFGCGGCKELRDLFQTFISEKRVNFLAVDQDLEALKFSKKLLKNLPPNVSIKYLSKNIIELIRSYRNRNSETPFTNKNLVYSIGLVDYFGDHTLQLFVRFCLKTLVPGGQLIFAHKNSDKQKSFLAPSWFCDWRFYQRNKNEVIKIIQDEIAGCNLKIKWEKTHHMFFLIITKKS